MPLRVQYMVACDYFFHDSVGKAGILGIFSRILIQRFPGALPLFHVVVGCEPFLASGEPIREVQVRIECEGQPWGIDAIPTTPIQLPVELVEGAAAGQLHLQFSLANIEFPFAGGYWVIFIANGEEAQRLGLGVVQAEGVEEGHQ